MKKLADIMYYFKIFLFIIHFYFIFIMLHDILDIKLFGYLFLLVYFVYLIKTILELLSQKRRYRNDIIYNSMQVGVIVYIMIVAIKVSVNEMYVTDITYSYFRTNYLIMSILFIFILVYGFLELNNKKKKTRND